jgi:opacity protein-like surface antigen
MMGGLGTRLCSRPAAGRHGGGSTCWAILMTVSAVALIMGAPSSASAQCIGDFSAIASVAATINTAFLPSGSAFLSSEPNSAPDQQGGGVWTRAVGGTVDTKPNTNFSGSFAVTTPPLLGGSGFQIPLSTSCSASVKQNFVGFEAGHDIARLNTGNSDWHFGVLAGYVGTKLDIPALGVDLPSQSADFEAPSAGLYASFSKGSFSADVQGRLYELQGESLGQRVDGRGYSLAGNMSYSFDLPGRWTLEPSVGGIFSRTSVDPLNIADVTGSLGVAVPGLLSATTIATLRGTMQVEDIESFLGRASVKLGTSLPLAGGQIVAYPFVTASVFHEFEGNVTALLSASGSFPSSLGTFQFQGAGNLTASSIGTYGQFGAGSAFQLADTGWLSFARVDYRTGEYIEGYSVSAGLRYQFNDPGHVAENRARYPVKAVLAEGYDWTGPYAGVSAGSTWGRTHWASQGDTVAPDYAGFLGGGQAGYNFQTGQFVGGIEADAGGSNARGSAPCPVQPLLYSCEDNIGALGSVTGRFGYAWGRALFYAKAGWAFGDVTAGRSVNVVDPLAAFPPAIGGVAKSTNWENGWTAGVGVEFALTDRWSAKAEYMHYEFPQYTFTVAPNAIASASTAGDTVRIGVNYHFWPR